MRSMINYIFIVIIFLFIFNIDVFADCSYQERKDLLNDAKLVDITVEPKIEIIETTGTTSFSEEPVTLTYEKYSFDFIISNLSEDLYIRYYNDYDDEEKYLSFSDLENGIYRFNISDASNLITYYFEMRSENNNCAGQVFYTKKIVKPIYNHYSEYSICQEGNVEEKDYCQKFVTKDLSLNESDFIEQANTVKEEQKSDEVKDSVNIFEFIQTYWYVFGGIFVLIIVVVVIIIIRKKREKLI